MHLNSRNVRRAALGLALVIAFAASAAAQTIVRDADERARTAYQVKVSLNFNGPVGATVPIPAGKRFVVEYVSMTSSAAASGGGVQPLILIGPTITGGNGFSYYFNLQQSPQAATQFFKSEQVRLYGDTIGVSIGYTGAMPYMLSANVMLSGYLVSMP